MLNVASGRRLVAGAPDAGSGAWRAAALMLLAFAAGCSRDVPASAGGKAPSASPEGSTRDIGANQAASAAPSGHASGSASPAAAGPPSNLNVLLISVDSMRADMPWAGYERDMAPVMKAFEAKSVSYSRYYSVSSYTAMSLGGMLAGRYPSQVDRTGYFFERYPESVLLFPQLLQKAGVRTLSAQAHFYFEQKAGFHHGFDVYQMVPNLDADNTTDKNITSPQHLELALKILGDPANTSKRFFAWFHFLDPHDQYMAHPGISFGKKARDAYDGEIAFVDQHIGKLLDFVAQQEWGKRTAIILTSDHGEAFGEHHMYRHGFEIYEMLVHVPLMIQAPGITPRRIDVPRSGVDIAPTVLEMLGAAPAPSFDGTSLVGEVYGKEAAERDVVVDLPRTSDNDRRRALIHGKYKLIAYGDDDAFELYDVVSDPAESKDLKRDEKQVFDDMVDLYKKKSATIHEVCPKFTDKLKGKKKGKPC